ncbi:GntR family transcriptional regulator [Sphingobium aquiterrae]|uniref:GntR family transcriptional regulator n=1 Tax=Sphingobium aquiterrae TaxID=2038656 RepID=UPI003015AC02
MKKKDGAADLIAAMEADLLGGRFRPGEWLKQADIEAMYSAHRFDVRMALLDLKVRHLIEHVKNRGYRVINLTEREREYLIETRTILETGAISLAAQRRSEEDISDLNALVHQFEDAIELGDLDVLRGLNAEFHDRLYQACGNLTLAAEIKALRQRGLPGARGWRSVPAIKNSNKDHAEMVQLLEARNGEALSAIVRAHLNRWREGPEN